LPKAEESALNAGREAVNTKTIREALRRLDAITSEAEKIRQLLAKVETTKARGKQPLKRAAKSQ
jgi:hypothetical protein